MKKIIEIYSQYWKVIKINTNIKYKEDLGVVKEIDFAYGDGYKESYIVKFENNESTLELFDVVYVIRDEVKDE